MENYSKLFLQHRSNVQKNVKKFIQNYVITQDMFRFQKLNK